MPLGPYLRAGTDLIPLPALPAGAIAPDYRDRPAPDGVPVVPQPGDWRPGAGRLAAQALAMPDGEGETVAALFTRLGHPGVFAPDGVPVTWVDADLPADAFRLEITSEGVTIAASGPGGRVYGLCMVCAWLVHSPDGLPCGVVEDAPRFGWRGQHLDCARHFFSVETILQLLDVMCLLRLNRFHWHFADDEAFRLQLPGLEALWRGLEYRGEGEVLPGLFGGGIRAGGSYSVEDIAKIVDHARALNIEILPEIEVPAHALGLCRLHPETRDPGDNGQEATVQGYRQSAVNPAMPGTWDLLHRMVDEVSAHFPFGHLHLGCDELAADTWMSSPAARDLMAREGLTDTKDLQGWMMSKLADYVTAKGLRPAAWEEAAQGSNGGIGHDAILFSWTGQGPGIDAARAGYDVVMTPAQHVYLDMAHTDDPDDWGATWAATVALADAVNWQPVPPEAADFADRIIGVQGTFWGEFTTRDDEVWPMLLPRMLGVSAMAWQDAPPSASALEALAGVYQRGLLRAV